MDLGPHLGTAPLLGRSWRGLPAEVQALRDGRSPLPEGLVLVRTFGARLPGAGGWVGIGLGVLFSAPFLIQEPAWLGAVILVGWAALGIWLVRGWRQGRAAVRPDWRRGWFLAEDGLLLAEGRHVSWLPAHSVGWVRLTEQAASRSAGGMQYGPDGEGVYVEASETAAVPVGMAVQVLGDAGGTTTLGSRPAVDPAERSRVADWAQVRGLTQAQRLGASQGRRYAGDTPKAPVLGAAVGALPEGLSAWLDPSQPLPAGVDLLDTGVPPRPGPGEWIWVGGAVAFLCLFSTLPLTVLHGDPALIRDKWVLALIALWALGIQLWLVRGQVLALLRNRARDEGRWRQGLFLTRAGVLLRAGGRATWLPAGAVEAVYLSNARGPALRPVETGAALRGSRFLAVAWAHDGSTGTVVHPHDPTTADFLRLRGWRRSSG